MRIKNLFKTLIIAIIIVVFTTISAEAATLYVSPSGGGTSCTNIAPCGSFQAAYNASSPGDTVEIAGGNYSSQVMLANSKSATAQRVIFRPALGAIVTLSGFRSGDPNAGNGVRSVELHNLRFRLNDGRDAHVTAFEGTNNVVWENWDAASAYLRGIKNFTVRGGDWGPCKAGGNFSIDMCANFKIDGASAPYGNENVTVDGAYFHDYRIVIGSGAHFECIFLNGGRNIVIRNSKFEDCAFYDIFVARRSGDAFDGLTIENNWFDTPWNEASNPIQSRATAIEFSHGGDTSDPWRNTLVRFNSFHETTGVSWNGDSTAYSTSGNRAIGNIMQNNICDSRWSYGYNLVVGNTCSSTDGIIGRPFPYVNPAHLPSGNWHLSGTRPIDFVPTSQAPDLISDIDGQMRPVGASLDAGSDEIQSSTPTPTPTPTITPTSTPTATPTVTPTPTPTSTPNPFVCDAEPICLDWKNRALKAENKIDRIKSITEEP